MGQSLDKPSSNEKDSFSFDNLNSRFNNFSFFERDNYFFLNENYINNNFEEQSIEINDRSLDINYENVNNQKDNPAVQNIDNIQTTKTEKNINANGKAYTKETNELNHPNNRNYQNNTFIGKKREFTQSNEEHFVLDKYIKKIRSIILNTLLNFFNSLIKVAFNGEIGQGMCKKQLLPINKKYLNLNHSYVESDKEFLNKKLKDIFSTISGRYTGYSKTHNKELIEIMINLQYYGNYFKELFELSFLDCLEHIRGTKNSELLDGLPKMEQILKNESKNLKNFDLNNIREIIEHYEDRVGERKSRAKKTEKK